MKTASPRIDPLLMLLLLLFFGTPLLLYLPSLESVVLPKTVFIGVLTAVLLAAVFLDPEYRPARLDALRTPLDAPLFLTLAACAVSIWLKGETLFSVPAWRILLGNLVLVYLIIYLFRKKPEWILPCRVALVAASVILAGYVVLQDYGLDPLGWAGGVPDWRGRLPGTMGNPNAVAGFLAVLMPTLVFQFLFARTLAGRIAMGIGLALIYMALTVTFSVGATLGMLFGGLLALWMLGKSDYRPLSWIAWTAVVALIAGFFLHGESSEQRSFMAAPLKAVGGWAPKLIGPALLVSAITWGAWLLHRRFRLPRTRVIVPPVLILASLTFYFTPNPWNGREGSILDQARASDRWKTGAGARRFIWKTTALMLDDDPAFGIGFGRYFKVHADYQGRLYIKRGTPHDRPTVGKVPQVHNEFYQQMAETGLVGSIPFFWLVCAILGLWKIAWDRTKRDAGEEEPKDRRVWVLAAILGLGIFMIHALTSFPLRRPSTWLAGAFLLAQVLAAADPKRGEVREKASALTSPRAALGVLLLVMTAFHVYWLVRPLLSSVELQKAVSQETPPLERTIHIQRAIAWDMNGFEPHFFAASAAFQRGNPALAISEARLALRSREDLDARQLIAESFEAMGDWQESAAAWDDVLRVNPCYPPFIEEGIRRHERAGEMEKARHLRQRAEKLATTDEHR